MDGPSNRSERSDLRSEEEALVAIRQAIEGIDYGSIVVTIHQGEVVSIETSRKVRLKGAADK